MPLTFKPRRGSAETYVRVREQARLSSQSRGKTSAAPRTTCRRAGEGVCVAFRSRRPAICFSISRAIRSRSRADANTCSASRRLTAATGPAWAFTDAMSAADSSGSSTRSSTAMRAHPEMHVYHYAPYEPTAFKRLMGRYATRERELDAMLRAGRFVDLYAVVRQGAARGHRAILDQESRAAVRIHARRSARRMPTMSAR